MRHFKPWRVGKPKGDNVFNAVKETMESEGMKYIVQALRAAHMGAYRRYRTISTDQQLAHLQEVQKVIDTTLPAIIERLLNQHLVQEGSAPPPKQEHFFEKFFKCPASWQAIKQRWKPARREG